METQRVVDTKVYRGKVWRDPKLVTVTKPDFKKNFLNHFYQTHPASKPAQIREVSEHGRGVLPYFILLEDGGLGDQHIQYITNYFDQMHGRVKYVKGSVEFVWYYDDAAFMLKMGRYYRYAEIRPNGLKVYLP